MRKVPLALPNAQTFFPPTHSWKQSEKCDLDLVLKCLYRTYRVDNIKLRGCFQFFHAVSNSWLCFCASYSNYHVIFSKPIVSFGDTFHMFYAFVGVLGCMNISALVANTEKLMQYCYYTDASMLLYQFTIDILNKQTCRCMCFILLNIL